MIHNIEALLTVPLFVIAAISPSDEVRMVCFCGVGAVLGGFVGAAQFPTSGKKTASRWAINMSLALFLGPLATAWLQPKFVDVPVYMLALATAGTIGMLGVGVVGFLIPQIYERLKRLLNAEPNKRNGSEN